MRIKQYVYPLHVFNFQKDYKLLVKRNYDISLLKNVIKKLLNGEKLNDVYNDHELKGIYRGQRECHIKPDWLLIYKIDNSKLILTATRTDTHSDLFYKIKR